MPNQLIKKIKNVKPNVFSSLGAQMYIRILVCK